MCMFVRVNVGFPDEKLHSLEELYSSKRHDHVKTGSVAVEDRLLLYQRQLEDRYNSELKREVHHRPSGLCWFTVPIKKII